MTVELIAPAAVAAAGGRVIGRRVEHVVRLAGSVGNHDFMLSTSIGDFVLKAIRTRILLRRPGHVSGSSGWVWSHRRLSG